MKKVTKFIICADARTGSHMLQTALNQHPNINCFGEILNPKSKDTFLNKYSNIEAISQALESDGIANGFIIHRHRKDIPEVWKYLQKHTDIKVIFTQRVDELGRYASYKKAKITKNWINTDGHPEKQIKIKFDEGEYLKFSGDYWLNLSKAEILLIDHQSVSIDYREMLEFWQNTVASIQRFLNVKVIELSPKTYKQETGVLKDIFDNYETINY